jgi:hypothetical protein
MHEQQQNGTPDLSLLTKKTQHRTPHNTLQGEHLHRGLGLTRTQLPTTSRVRYVLLFNPIPSIHLTLTPAYRVNPSALAHVPKGFKDKCHRPGILRGRRGHRRWQRVLRGRWAAGDSSPWATGSLRERVETGLRGRSWQYGGMYIYTHTCT